MDSTPLAIERFLQWANIAYIAAVGIAAVATVAIYHLSTRVTAAKDREPSLPTCPRHRRPMELV